MISEQVTRWADGYEQVVRFYDADTGLHAFIAVHSTALGPALGGVRFHAYPTPADALADALRLAKGMTYKAAAAGLDLGGGKAVIHGDPAALRSPALLRSFGRAVESLEGRYITAEDVGTTVADMVEVARQTSHVVGRPEAAGGLGDPSPSTALGVLAAMQAALAFVDGHDDLASRTVAVCGLGKVGWPLTELLVACGASVVVADVDAERTTEAALEFGVKTVDPSEIHSVDADVYAPCAMGGALNERTIPELGARVVAGSANNQLADRTGAEELARGGVVYVPDFLANAGGLIHVARELFPGTASVADEVCRLGDRVTAVLQRAEEEGVSTLAAAEALAEQRLAAAMS